MMLDEAMEMTFTIEDADLDKLHDVLKDVNVMKCPWFEVQDKYGNKARYYREPERKGKWIVYESSDGLLRRCTCDQCGHETYGMQWRNPNFCSNCGADMKEGNAE